MAQRADPDVSLGTLLNRGLRRARVGGIVVGIAALLYIFQDIAKLFLAAALVAYILSPLVSRLQVRTDRTTATLVVFAGVVGIGGGFVYLLGPVIQGEIRAIGETVQRQQILQVLDRVDQWFNSVLASFGGGTVNLSERFARRLSRLGQQVVESAPAVLGLASNAVLVPFIAAFLLRDGPRIKRGLIRLVPNRYFEFSLEAIHKVDQQLGNYFRGLTLEIAIISVMSAGALWGLGVQSFVLLGLLAGITTVIPYAGSLLGGSVAVLVHLSTTADPYAAMLVLLAFLGIQVLDEAVIQPLVFAQAVNLHPLAVLLAVWVGAQVLGVVGMVAAIPVTAAGQVVVTEGAALIQQYEFG